MNALAIQFQKLEADELNRLAEIPVKTRPHETPRPAGAPRPAPKWRRQLVILGTGLLALLAGYGGYRWWLHAATWAATDNAYVAGHIHTVSPRIAGTVSEVLVKENQSVAAGNVLARLDPADLKVRQEQARAAVAQAEAQRAQAAALVAREQASLTRAQLEFDRADRLLHGATGAISKQEFDNARAALDATRASLNAAHAAASAAQAQQQVAAANLRDADLQMGYTEINAPAAGRIGRKNLEVGNRVQPGQALLAIVQSDVWVTANFKETQLARLQPGQPVRLRLDTFPGRTFTGRIESLSPASGAQFALLPPDNATGNFTKIVQRVPVKIVFDDAAANELAGRIVLGMSAVVKVNVRD